MSYSKCTQMVILQLFVVCICICVGCASFNQSANEVAGSETLTQSKIVAESNYTFDVPEDVICNKSTSVSDLYKFSWGSLSNTAMLQITILCEKMSDEEFMALADRVAGTLSLDAPAGAFQRKELRLGIFEGTELLQIIKLPSDEIVYRPLLLLQDDQRIWEGQIYAFSTNDLKKAYAILRSARHIGEESEGIGIGPMK